MSIQAGVQLAKRERYHEALALLEEQYQMDAASFNSWDLYYLSKCLRKIGRLSESSKIGRDVYRQSPELGANTNQYAHNLFDLYVKQDAEQKIDEARLFKIADFITLITKQERFSPYERTVFEVLKYLKKKDNPSPILMKTWLDKLDPSLLKDEAYTFTDGEGKLRELASPLEDWHRLRVTVLSRMEEWNSCIEAADEALRSIPKFHYNNNIWIGIDQALAFVKLGQIEQAIKLLEKLVVESNHWKPQYELYKLQLVTGDLIAARLSWASALLSRSGELKHKIKLIVDVGDLLEKLGEEKEALMHYCLYRDLRVENGWPVNDKVHEHIRILEARCGAVPTDYRRVLERFWSDQKLSVLPKGTGTISQILDNGKAGFLLDESHGRIFFRVQDFRGPRNQVKAGLQVQFYISDSYDTKKQRMSKQAIEIRPLDRRGRE